MVVSRVALVVSSLVTTLVVSLGLVAQPAGADAVATPAAPSGRWAAQKALVRAERLLSPRPHAHGRSRSVVGAPDVAVRVAARGEGDVTMALREVALSRADLGPASQQRAERLLARPVTDAAIGNADLVVHYTAATYGAGRANAGYPQLVLDTATYVHDSYLAAGYRVPRSDGGAGGDARIDIYLTNLGTTGAYGYCGSDQPPSPGSARRDRWAFCVLDDGYTEYRGKPTEVLQVTLAHEYFHAVQFAYDAGEDGWFMEGTAVWAEDELFDDVDDNVQYAAYSPLAGPSRSLDLYQRAGLRQYGSWLWFRWLAERFPDSQAGVPTIVRDLWQAADSTRGNVDKKYSLSALAGVLKARGLPLAQAFALFADANRRPASSYSEAAANRYPVAPPAATVAITGRGATTRSFRLDHLASATTRLVPSPDQRRRRHLRVSVDMADKAQGSVAVASTYLRSGAVRTSVVTLDGHGNGTVRLAFAAARVTAVEVTLVNASRRFRDCYQKGARFSCFGTPLDQRLVEQVSATPVR